MEVERNEAAEVNRIKVMKKCACLVKILEQNNIGTLLNFKQGSDMLLVIVLKYGPIFFGTTPTESRLCDCLSTRIQQKCGCGSFQEFAFPGNV